MNPDATDSTLPPTETASVEPAPPATEPQAAPPAPAGEKMLPQSEVNRLLAAEKRKTREQVERERQAPTPAAKNSQVHTQPDPIAEIQQLRSDLAFNEVLNDSGLTLSRKQRELLRHRFDPANPESVLDIAREVYPQPVASAKPAAVAPSPAVVKAPSGAVPTPPAVYASPGAPGGSPDAGLDSDPTRWTKDEIRAYEADGTFMTRISRWKASQPGGGGPNLFPNRAPKR